MRLKVSEAGRSAKMALEIFHSKRTLGLMVPGDESQAVCMREKFLHENGRKFDKVGRTACS